MTASILVKRIDHVAIDVTDMAKARSFYNDLLGLKEIPRPPSFDFDGAWYRIGNDTLHIVHRTQRDADAPRHFCLWVADVRAAAAAIEKAGYPVRWEARYKIPSIDRFFTADSDGNRIEFQGDESNQSA